MSSKQQLDALAAERSHNATLRKMILLVALLGGVGMYFAHSLPKSIDLHVATDMKAGDTVHFQDGQAVVPDVNVYASPTTSGSRSTAGRPMARRTTVRRSSGSRPM